MCVNSSDHWSCHGACGYLVAYRMAQNDVSLWKRPGDKMGGNAWETPFLGPPFLESGVSGPQRAFGNAHCTFPGRKDGFLYVLFDSDLLAGMWEDIIAAEIFLCTTQSEFDQDNGLTRNTVGPVHNERGPHIFTVPTTLKLHCNPWSMR